MSDNKEYTDIQVIVFEDDDGNEMEMQIVDEFDYEGRHIIALAPPVDAEEDEDEVSFFAASGPDEDLDMELIEDKALIDALGDLLEERLLSTGLK